MDRKTERHFGGRRIIGHRSNLKAGEIEMDNFNHLAGNYRRHNQQLSTGVGISIDSVSRKKEQRQCCPNTASYAICKSCPSSVRV